MLREGADEQHPTQPSVLARDGGCRAVAWASHTTPQTAFEHRFKHFRSSWRLVEAWASPLSIIRIVMGQYHQDDSFVNLLVRMYEYRRKQLTELRINAII